MVNVSHRLGDEETLDVCLVDRDTARHMHDSKVRVVASAQNAPEGICHCLYRFVSVRDEGKQKRPEVLCVLATLPRQPATAAAARTLLLFCTQIVLGAPAGLLPFGFAHLGSGGP